MEKILNYSFRFDSLTISTLDLLQIVIIIIVMKIAVFFSRRALEKYFNAKGIDEGRAFAMSRFIKYAIYIVAILLIFNSLGISMNGLMLGSAGLLVGIGFGLQQTFSNFIAGIILLVEGDIQVGDKIVVNGEIGIIRSIGARTCRIETRDEKDHIIPNSQITGDHIIHLSLASEKSRFTVNIGVAYKSDPQKVTDILLTCANDHNQILTLPPPRVQFSDFGDSSLDFKLQFYTNDYMNIEATRSDLRYRIFQSLKENKIEIPFPQRDLWLKNYG